MARPRSNALRKSSSKDGKPNIFTKFVDWPGYSGRRPVQRAAEAVLIDERTVDNYFKILKVETREDGSLLLRFSTEKGPIGKQIAQDVLRLAKAYCPTGKEPSYKRKSDQDRLKNSYKLYQVNQYAYDIYSPLPYAATLEYGASSRPIKPRKRNWLAFWVEYPRVGTRKRR